MRAEVMALTKKPAEADAIALLAQMACAWARVSSLRNPKLIVPPKLYVEAVKAGFPADRMLVAGSRPRRRGTWR